VVADGQSDRVIAERVQHRRREPAWVAELDRMPARRQRLEPVSQAPVVTVEVLRQLPQHRPQPPGIDQRLQWLVEALDSILDRGQALDVGQVPARLDDELEVPRRLLCPVGHGITPCEAIEGRIDLDGVELLCVELEPAALGLPFGVEPAAPAVVHPSGAADAYWVSVGRGHKGELPETARWRRPGSRFRLPEAGRPCLESRELRKRSTMSLTDKVTGKVKQAAGDLSGDASLRREGAKEERKGEAKDELARTEERADAKADEVADLERKTA